MSANDKTYTEVLIEVYEKIDNVERRIVGKIDDVVSDNADFRVELAKGGAKFKAIDDKLDGEGGVNERIKTNSTDIKNVRNLNTFIALLGSTIAGIIGTQK